MLGISIGMCLNAWFHFYSGAADSKHPADGLSYMRWIFACSIKRHFINTERRVVFKMKIVFNAEETPKISLHRWSLNFFQCLISLMMLFHAKVGVLDSSRRLEGAAKNVVTEGFIGANQQTCANIWEGTSETSSSKDAIDYRALLKCPFSTFDIFWFIFCLLSTHVMRWRTDIGEIRTLFTIAIQMWPAGLKWPQPFNAPTHERMSGVRSLVNMTRFSFLN